MTTAITNYTTSDDITVKHQLIESYLPLAKHLAIALCGLSSNLRLDAYVAAYVRGAIKQTLATDDLLPLPSQARERARAEGMLEQLYAQHRVASLDEQMEWFDTDEVEEPPAKPILPTEAAPVRDPQQRAQVDTLLSYLSLRAQAILRLRYGLCDANERRHTTNEIARLLGLDRRLILTTERDALYTLFYEYYRGYTIYSTQEGRCCIHGKQGCIKLRGKYVCFPDFEDAKTLIKRFRAEVHEAERVRNMTMKQRNHRHTGQDEPQTITKAVTHIRLKATNGGKLAALDELAQVYLPLCQQYVTLCTLAPGRYPAGRRHR